MVPTRLAARAVASHVDHILACVLTNSESEAPMGTHDSCPGDLGGKSEAERATKRGGGVVRCFGGQKG
jgi:hypothetical protein